jgi:hypothetical protein
MERTTRKQVDGLLEQINRQGIGRFYVEGSATGFNLYEELDHGVHDVLFGRTKAEIYAKLHAFLAGAVYANGRVQV